MRKARIDNAHDVASAREEILNLIQGSPDENIIYFDGWNGFGATAVLRSIQQALVSMKAPPPRLSFGRVIFIDCSAWKSKREMQRKIAEELKLHQKTMAMFEKQDEDDDFYGEDHGSRDVIKGVSAIIDQTLRESRFMMIFLNGSPHEIALTDFGIPEYYCAIVWTFSRMFVTTYEEKDIHKLAESLRRTDLFIYTRFKPTDLSGLELNALFREEAANIIARYPFMRDMDVTMVVDYCLYRFFLHHGSHRTIGLDWAAHAPNFWICDEIIQKRNGTREIVNTLDSEISFEGDATMLDIVFAEMMRHLKTYYLVAGDEEDGESVDKYGEGPYRWISVTSENKIVQDKMQAALATASSIFLEFGKSTSAPRLPNALFKQCSKLGVLILSGCAFSFVSPPFLHCRSLRFLGLSNCTHQNNTAGVEGVERVTKWTCLHNLWVLDLRYTDWGEILSEEKIGLMANLEELNIEGVRCWLYMSRQLQKKLPCLERLRIVKPTHREETSAAVDMADDSSLEDRKGLEILDLSGNSDMKNIPAKLPEASRLQTLVLDGCDELENVVLSNSSLRSFSYDGYGPALHWTSTGKLPPMSSRPKSRSVVDKKDAKTCKISLQGCAMLEDVFLRGLPNLVELDLSGCAIKVLDFGAMVVDVPMLKRLFLLGCECLRAIAWGSGEQRSKLLQQLELICIDTTRPWSRRPSLGNQQQSFQQLGVHAVFTDARFARSLGGLIRGSRLDSCFNICITSSAAEATTRRNSQQEMMAGRGRFGDRQRHCAAAGMYADVLTKATSNGSAPAMQVFPQAPTAGQQGRRHIEIGDGSCNVQSEAEVPDPSRSDNMATLMLYRAESLHVHDVSAYSNTLLAGDWWDRLRWCCVERCPKLHAVFPRGSDDWNGTLEAIWASDLLMARCVWSKGAIYDDLLVSERFRSLRHLHLRRCPSLRFALAMGRPSSFPSLETLHIIHCGDLRHVFVSGDEEHRHPSVEFPKLTTIHLYDLPSLQRICEATKTMQAPALETIKIRGCPNMRWLPALKGHQPSFRRPSVEMEKDVWDALQWDGLDAGHHPSLYEAPVHSRHYKTRRVLRGTVLR